MGALLLLFLLLLPLAAAAQSSLPLCPPNIREYWRNCYGTFTFAIGEKYVGEYQDGKRNGQGLFIYSSGDTYVGEFKDGKRSGQGTYTFADSEIYVGEFSNGKFDVQVTLPLTGGGKYVGEYKEDHRNGQGIEYRTDGTVRRSGWWADGDLIHPFAIDLSRFPFNAPTPTSAPVAQPASTVKDRIGSGAQAVRQPQLKLNQRLAAVRSAQTNSAHPRLPQLKPAVQTAPRPQVNKTEPQEVKPAPQVARSAPNAPVPERKADVPAWEADVAARKAEVPSRKPDVPSRKPDVPSPMNGLRIYIED